MLSQQEDTFTNSGSSLFSTAVSVLQLKVRWLVVVGCRELVVITTCMQQQRYETHDRAVTKTIHQGPAESTKSPFVSRKNKSSGS
jgi:hypothetical protein